MTDLTPEIASEAMAPWLSRESFKICGKTVQVKPLSVRYQMLFMQTIRPLLTGAAERVDETMLWTAGAEALTHSEILPELILLVCLNDKQAITLDDILDQSEVGLGEMGKILLALAAKNEEVGRPVLDFFWTVWPLFSGALAKIKNRVPDLIKARLYSSPDSSAASVSDSATA